MKHGSLFSNDEELYVEDVGEYNIGFLKKFNLAASSFLNFELHGAGNWNSHSSVIVTYFNNTSKALHKSQNNFLCTSLLDQ